MKYTTEIVVADDRYVCLQLPNYVPMGRALVTVRFEVGEIDPEDPTKNGGEHEDIEWWDDAEPGEAPETQVDGVSPANRLT